MILATYNNNIVYQEETPSLKILQCEQYHFVEIFLCLVHTVNQRLLVSFNRNHNRLNYYTTKKTQEVFDLVLLNVMCLYTQIYL